MRAQELQPLSPKKMPADVWIFLLIGQRVMQVCVENLERMRGTGRCTYPSPVALPHEYYLIVSHYTHEVEMVCQVHFQKRSRMPGSLKKW
jgi:hypothetical protein